ncbi:hypothetical protein ACFFUT_17980 [Pseudohalocynthiibacter aestuariivivens]|uniref:Uncharacterized protein n=1 Tax=Pseudohalocynthiibacter aestuariivivens TaxID=1591409 RepID=A0ABV5JLD4_9RHOB|nr:MULTISPECIES: hypothetical protein [Pseudohalocynthiibacter]MBS9717567.1 hypothetical protein [Pseudohalocynthiibacter aestuariivivens]MCK0102765.1 hypothetical protein [Pseudohalocynthiibacter sp. F2068]
MTHETNPRFFFNDGTINLKAAIQAGRNARAEAAKGLFVDATSFANATAKKTISFFGKGFVKVAATMSLVTLFSACASEGPTKSTKSFVHPMNDFATFHIPYN